MMRDFNKRFNRMQRFVQFFIGFVFFLIVAYVIAMGVVAYKAVDAVKGEDWSGGIKPVIEKLWCGKPGCLG